MVVVTGTRVDRIVDALLRNAGTLDFSPEVARVFIQTLRRLTQGRPVSDDEVTAIATEFGVSGEEANSALNWVAERNDDGHIIGMAGLSQNEWTHQFKVNGRNLTTWCALDTLYLPQILKQTAIVASPDPQTGQPIRLTIGPDRVDHDAPGEAILSIVVPNTDGKGLESAEEIYMAFCSYSHFFTSIETAQEWFKDKHVEPIFLSIHEGHELGRKWFAPVIQHA